MSPTTKGEAKRNESLSTKRDTLILCAQVYAHTASRLCVFFAQSCSCYTSQGRQYLSSLAFYCHYKPSSRNNLRQSRKYYYIVFARKLITLQSMLKQVISLQGQQWTRMKSTATRGGRAKQLRISTVLDVWVENESQGPKNEKPPPSKSEICKKQQDL